MQCVHWCTIHHFVVPPTFSSRSTPLDIRVFDRSLGSIICETEVNVGPIVITDKLLQFAINHTSVSRCLRRTSQTCASRCQQHLVARVYTVVLTPWLENPALSTVMIRITQLLCVRSRSLELTSNSRSWLVIIILLLSPSENWTV